MRPKAQASDVLDPPLTSAISDFPLSEELVKPLPPSEPGLGLCQFSGTEVRVSSFQKAWQAREMGSRRPVLGFLFDLLLPSFKDESQLCRARRSGAGGPGVPPRVQVERSVDPGSLLSSRGLNGQLPKKATVAEAPPWALRAALGPLGLWL